MNTQTSLGSAILTIHVAKSNARIKFNHAWILLMYLLLLIQTSSSESEIITIDVHIADDLLHTGKYRFLDVRTSEEFNKGHVDFHDALNVPYMFNTPQGRVKNANFLEQVQPLCTKDDRLVVGCQSGIRSVYATNILLDAGFKHVYNMKGGYLEWVENGLPVAAVTTPKVEL